MKTTNCINMVLFPYSSRKEKHIEREGIDWRRVQSNRLWKGEEWYRTSGISDDRRWRSKV